MLISIQSRINEEEILEILGYSVFPDPDHLEKTARAYQEDKGLELYGYESEGEIVGIIGIYMDEERTLTIRHLAVKPELRSMGFGRGLILEVLDLKQPVLLLAETDEEAVDFYRNIGFEVASLGEKYPGVERFRCTYETQV